MDSGSRRNEDLATAARRSRRMLRRDLLITLAVAVVAFLLAGRGERGMKLELGEKAIAATSTPHAPWYVIPADQKWYARYLVSEAVVGVLQDCDPQFPTVSEADLAEMAECRRRLVNGEA